MQEAELWALEAAKVLASKNLDKLLDLFDDDAIVYEPFSTQSVLCGLGEIEPFLKVVCGNRGFLFDESFKVKDMKYLPSEAPHVRLVMAGPVSYLVEFEFREVLVKELRKSVGKVKKLRIDVEG